MNCTLLFQLEQLVRGCVRKLVLIYEKAIAVTVLWLSTSYLYNLGRRLDDLVAGFLFKKNLPGPHMNKLKRFSEIFRFRKDICEKRVLALSLTTPTYGTLFDLTTRTRQLLHGHRLLIDKIK